MPIQSAADLMILLLHAKGSSSQHNEEIFGITRLEKLIYLLLKEGGFQDTLSSEIEYQAYDFGPYSPEIYDIIESLKGMKIVKVREQQISNIKEIVDIYYAEAKGQMDELSGKKMEIYSLTSDRGLLVAEMLISRASQEEIQKIENIKKSYNPRSLEDLLRYVYKTYPESAKKSKIIENILGFGKRPDLKSFDREEDV